MRVGELVDRLSRAELSAREYRAVLTLARLRRPVAAAALMAELGIRDKGDFSRLMEGLKTGGWVIKVVDGRNRSYAIVDLQVNHKVDSQVNLGGKVDSQVNQQPIVDSQVNHLGGESLPPDGSPLTTPSFPSLPGPVKEIETTTTTTTVDSGTQAAAAKGPGSRASSEFEELYTDLREHIPRAQFGEAALRHRLAGWVNRPAVGLIGVRTALNLLDNAIREKRVSGSKMTWLESTIENRRREQANGSSAKHRTADVLHTAGR